jgi:hypothetical protein
MITGSAVGNQTYHKSLKPVKESGTAPAFWWSGARYGSVEKTLAKLQGEPRRVWLITICVTPHLTGREATSGTRVGGRYTSNDDKYQKQLCHMSFLQQAPPGSGWIWTIRSEMAGCK